MTVHDERAHRERLVRHLTEEHRQRLAEAAERTRAALERADRPVARPRRVAEPDDEEDYSTRTWLR